MKKKIALLLVAILTFCTFAPVNAREAIDSQELNEDFTDMSEETMFSSGAFDVGPEEETEPLVPDINPDTEEELEATKAAYFGYWMEYFPLYVIKGDSFSLPPAQSFSSKYSKIKYSFIWESSDTKVMSVSKGTAKAKAAGKTTLQLVEVISGKELNSGGKWVKVYEEVRDDDEKAEITVIDPVLEEKSLTLSRWETHNLTFSGIDDSTLSHVTIDCSSTNPDVATVDQDGQIFANAAGQTVINILVSGKRFSCKVKVTDFPAVTSFSDEEVALMPLQTVPIKKKGFSPSGATWNNFEEILDAKGKVTGYQNGIVMIDKGGKMTAIGVGEASVSGTDKNGNTLSFHVGVNDTSVNHSNVYVNKGKTKKIKIPGVKMADAVWDQTSGADVVELQKKKDVFSGSVKGLAFGESKLTCKYLPKELEGMTYKGSPLQGITFTTMIYVEDPVFSGAIEGSVDKSLSDPESAADKLYRSGTDKYEILLWNGESFTSDALMLSGIHQTVMFTGNNYGLANAYAAQVSSDTTAKVTLKAGHSLSGMTTLKKVPLTANINGRKIKLDVYVICEGFFS